jgi:AcrR family transcriptional regulator
MVQKSPAKRGRPRAYDPETALRRALGVFWDSGYAATSLDDLSAATGMNRPSLYAAFGDKREIYRKAIEHYRATARTGMREALDYERPLRDAIKGVYDRALEMYYSGEKGRGCFLIATAVTEAVSDPELRAGLRDGFEAIEQAFERRIRHAREQGELPDSADTVALAKLASAFLYYLAIRSRAGEQREALEAGAEIAVDLVCGPTKPPGRRRRTG